MVALYSRHGATSGSEQSQALLIGVHPAPALATFAPGWRLRNLRRTAWASLLVMLAATEAGWREILCGLFDTYAVRERGRFILIGLVACLAGAELHRLLFRLGPSRRSVPPSGSWDEVVDDGEQRDGA